MLDNNLETTISSATQSVTISRNGPVVMIGERINPTGRKKLMAALQAGNLDVVRRDAAAQVEAGAAILDVNAGLPGADELSHGVHDQVQPFVPPDASQRQ